MELVTISFSVPTALLNGLYDAFVLWFCVGSLVFLPWSIYRAQDRNKEYQYTASRRGLPIVLLVILLWPLALRVIIKEDR